MNLHTDSNALALKLQSRDATREPTLGTLYAHYNCTDFFP